MVASTVCLVRFKPTAGSSLFAAAPENREKWSLPVTNSNMTEDQGRITALKRRATLVGAVAAACQLPAVSIQDDIEIADSG